MDARLVAYVSKEDKEKFEEIAKDKGSKASVMLREFVKEVIKESE